MRKSRVSLVLVGLSGVLALLTGCSYDGDHRVTAGLVIEAQNVEATAGKNAGQSPSRGPAKFARSTSANVGSSVSASGFPR